MRTIQINLDVELVETIDQIVKILKTTRSAFVRKALQNAVDNVNVNILEQKHKQGYGQTPAAKMEFRVWETEQEWGAR